MLYTILLPQHSLSGVRCIVRVCFWMRQFLLGSKLEKVKPYETTCSVSVYFKRVSSLTSFWTIFTPSAVAVSRVFRLFVFTSEMSHSNIPPRVVVKISVCSLSCETLKKN